jgi:hypothetical protein
VTAAGRQAAIPRATVDDVVRALGHDPAAVTRIEIAADAVLVFARAGSRYTACTRHPIDEGRAAAQTRPEEAS